ncbi:MULTISPECIES: YnhF family membrane protein [unclassified Gilliamella]|nr:YnhF family membrane protein [Gilliamella sp. ESL0441]QYN44851.1 YnhF family membrane protein [Gilliamella sp. ESL0441]
MNTDLKYALLTVIASLGVIAVFGIIVCMN